MKNEILEELCQVKDKVSEASNFDIETLAKKLRKKELKSNVKIVDFTTEPSFKNKKNRITKAST